MRFQLALNVKDLDAAIDSHDVDGTMVEWYRVLGDSQTFFAEPESAASETSCCATAEAG